jgi:hypothetical protein
VVALPREIPHGLAVQTSRAMLTMETHAGLELAWVPRRLAMHAAHRWPRMQRRARRYAGSSASSALRLLILALLVVSARVAKSIWTSEVRRGGVNSPGTGRNKRGESWPGWVQAPSRVSKCLAAMTERLHRGRVSEGGRFHSRTPEQQSHSQRGRNGSSRSPIAADSTRHQSEMCMRACWLQRAP